MAIDIQKCPQKYSIRWGRRQLPADRRDHIVRRRRAAPAAARAEAAGVPAYWLQEPVELASGAKIAVRVTPLSDYSDEPKVTSRFPRQVVLDYLPR